MEAPRSITLDAGSISAGALTQVSQVYIFKSTKGRYIATNCFKLFSLFHGTAKLFVMLVFLSTKLS